jgi:hypothetical protein
MYGIQRPGTCTIPLNEVILPSGVNGCRDSEQKRVALFKPAADLTRAALRQPPEDIGCGGADAIILLGLREEPIHHVGLGLVLVRSAGGRAPHQDAPDDLRGRSANNLELVDVGVYTLAPHKQTTISRTHAPHARLIDTSATPLTYSMRCYICPNTQRRIDGRPCTQAM